MPGNGKNGKRKKGVIEPKEKKAMSSAEAKADDRASGQQGLVSAMAAHASTVTQHRSKDEILAEFRAQNDLEKDAEKVRHNYQIYSRYYQEHARRCKICLEYFKWSRALGEGHPCFFDSKNLQELKKRRLNKIVPHHSAEGDSTDYNTEADTLMQEVLAEMPPLMSRLLAPSLPAGKAGPSPKRSRPAVAAAAAAATYTAAYYQWGWVWAASESFVHAARI